MAVDPSGRTDATGQPLVLGTALTVEPAEAQTVRRIFEWFAGGVSLRAIAHRLNAEQIPFPAEPTRQGGKRKGWASSAVRVILRNEKYVGRWVYGRRMFVKDPLTGRRTARLRPPAEWQVAEHPSLRVIAPDVWETVQAKFQRLAASYPRSRGRLAGRTAGSPSGRASLFSGVLHCVCGGTLVVVSGDPRRAERRYGCGFHREKGPQVCANALTVKVDTVERRLLEEIRVKLLTPEAVRYLITAANQHLDTFRVAEGEARRRLEQELGQVEEELRNVERAILAGVVSETTAALVQDREAQRRALKNRLAALEARRGTGPLRIDAATITAQLARLNDLLGRDVARANSFFRGHLTPIVCAPIREAGRRFYRATVAAKGAEIIKSLGLVPQAFDFGGCGGPQSPKLTHLGSVIDVI